MSASRRVHFCDQYGDDDDWRAHYETMLTFPCSPEGDAPKLRVTGLGAGSVYGMQKR